MIKTKNELELLQLKFDDKCDAFSKLESLMAERIKFEVKLQTEELEKAKATLHKFREHCAALKVALD